MVGKTLRTLAMAVVLAAPLAGITLAVDTARATTLAPLTVEQQTDASDLIVRGEITETWTEADDKGRIWSRARMKVSTTFKGKDDHDEIVIDSMGGTYGGQTLHVEAQAEFSKYEDAIVFLHLRDDGRYVPVGMFLGKYTVRRAPDVNRHYVRTWHPKAGQKFDARFIPHVPPEKRVYLDTLIDKIETRLDTGWDGQPIPGASMEAMAAKNTLEMRRR